MDGVSSSCCLLFCAWPIYWNSSPGSSEVYLRSVSTLSLVVAFRVSQLLSVIFVSLFAFQVTITCLVRLVFGLL